ncbi:MAG TPA: hypothetical protein VJZ00_03910 [Thermoanaerobaculia bacterium]|nr:hypothetical protein [Thermoanaerobaculia bacterium]
MRRAHYVLLFSFTFVVCASKPHVVATVKGKPISLAEIHSSPAQLRDKLWCEVARASGAAPSSAELRAYKKRAGATPLCTTKGRRDYALELRLENYKRESPNALVEAQQSGIVKITDPDYASAIETPAPVYTMRTLNEPEQVRIDCANGTSFVVRRAADGKWYEEMRVRGGLQPAYASAADAASKRCSSQ